MISNNKISHLVKSQAPFFVRNDHENFIRFMECYYEYLEQESKVVNILKTSKENMDIDLTVDEFADHLYNMYMHIMPTDILADKKLVLKHIKDFYRAKGTEKAARFLMHILYNQDIEVYYPKKDVIRASDGKWFIQKSLRITDTKINSILDTTLSGLESFIGTQIRGETSNTTAIVERVDRLYEQGTQVDELIISNIDGSFINGEEICACSDTIRANIFSGVLNTVTIQNSGSGYQIGDPVIVVSNTGSGACVVVGSVTTGNISFITIPSESGGAGYRANDFILSTGGGGAGLNAWVSLVETNEAHHPNTYNIMFQTISLEANTLIGNTTYSNLRSANVNTSIANATNNWVYSNTGPAQLIVVISPGDGYTSTPMLSIIANSAIQQLGILGRMQIVNGGTGYKIGDQIEFINVWGGYGVGATANVTNVGTANTITDVRFQKMSGHIIGGSGYNQNFLPRANVISTTGTGANIQVTCILGSGASPKAFNTSIGGINRIIVLNKGSGYTSIPSLNLMASGDGTAQANVSIISGVYSYPGRYLNDDGHLSSYNFIQDRDYYQNFSYSIRVKQSIDKYRQIFKDLIHPAGTKLFGEYTYVNQNEDYITSSDTNTAARVVMSLKSYMMNLNVVNVSYTSHPFANNANVYLEYQSGDLANVRNGISRIIFTSTNYFKVSQNLASAGNTSGQVLVGMAIE